MSFSRTVTYETGSNGDAITTANTGSDTLRQTAGAGTAAIATAQSHSGTRSLHMTGTSTSGLWCVEDGIGTLTTWTDDFYLYVAVLPSAEISLRRLTDTGGAVCKLGLNGVGALVLRDSTGSSLYASAAGKRITAGTWVHIIWEATIGASGTQRMRWYQAGTSTATDDSTTLASNNGTGNFSIHRRGAKCETSAATADLYFDDETMSGTTAASPPTASFTYAVTGLNISVNASGSSAVSPASISSYAWDFGDGSSGSGQVTSRTYVAPGSYTISLSVTDSLGSNGQSSQTISIMTASVPVYIYHAGQWVNSTFYTYHAGQWVQAQ